ncbi:unnamed protein product [Vitrella brassicaformis CCMP3155]|uniref:Uncharacterized protein n=1 Tax=Vitrella brassicaformis (strain CCMP3155) TaxID=1169540 RepID=A0A0G4FX67_VITBC|nr:unnamed protein product [Vitrella brassicaformis CCMP3155]|eukprot:CEM19432.1 unnamed protein product [Vitrella brassicaformis CCMP3155]
MQKPRTTRPLQTTIMSTSKCFGASYREGWWYKWERREGILVVEGDHGKSVSLRATLFEKDCNGRRGDIVIGPVDLASKDIDKFK